MIVAIVSGSPAEVVADLAALAVRRASISEEVAAEVRLDLMDPPDPGVFANAPLPLLATCRRPRDGGRFRGGEGDRLDLLRRAAAAGARWVDVESDVLPSWSAVPRTSVIGSFHDFDKTPADLPALVMQVLGSGASVVKVATRTRSLLDLLTLSAAVGQAPGRVVAVGIGPSGAASRILADRLGSAWTYVRWSARGRPGPPELEDAGIPELGELVDFFRGGRLDRGAPAFAVVGDRADESIGPRVFNRVFRERRIAATYVHLKTPSLAGLREVCRLFDIRGLSVTTPFKEDVLAAADRVEDSARSIGAANTLALRGGEWVASNTDRDGVSDSLAAVLRELHREAAGLTALVAGAGGMGRAAAAALRTLGLGVAMTSRGAERLRRASEALGIEGIAAGDAASRRWDVLVNATPAGSSRDPDGRALDAAWAAPGGIVMESSYRPLETRFVREARARGLTAITGDRVYAAQAAAQLRIFLPEIEAPALEGSDHMGPRVDRIVLIGLRRSGKSTVGRLVSDVLGWALIDTDELVHRITGTSPADWIRDRGLAAFRAAERAAVATLEGVRNAVIATGGGVALSQENREILRPGALVVYLRVDPWVLVGRTIADPSAALRPPLAVGSPSEENFVLFAERDAIYRRFCDLIVDGARTPDEVAARVLDASNIEKKDHPS